MGGLLLHATAHWSVATLPDQTMLLLHVRGLGIGVASQVAIYNGLYLVIYHIQL